VTEANAGTMPVVGMPSTLHPASPMWRTATSKTRLPFLADQARLGLFSVGDLVLQFGDSLIVAICLRRTLKMKGSQNCKRLGWVLRDTAGHVTCHGKTQTSEPCPAGFPADRAARDQHGNDQQDHEETTRVRNCSAVPWTPYRSFVIKLKVLSYGSASRPKC
jgi:hypothetical protein